MNQVDRYKLVVGIILLLVLKASWGSLLYTNLQTPWVLNNRWNLLPRLYPWLYMAEQAVLFPRFICPPNETFAQFGAPCGKSCGTYGQFCPIVRLNQCVCIRAHVRNREGACVHYTDCMKTLDDVEFLH